MGQKRTTQNMGTAVISPRKLAEREKRRKERLELSAKLKAKIESFRTKLK